MSASEKTADLAALLRARCPVIWINSREEARVEGAVIEAAASAGYLTRLWDVAAGCTGIDGRAVNIGGPDPAAMLGAILDRSARSERCVWVMRDLGPWLVGPVGMSTVRAVRNLARSLPTVPRDSAQALVIISTSPDVPPELTNHCAVVDWPLPDRAEIAAILDAAIAALPEEMQATAAPNGTRDAAIDAAVGLSGEEAAGCYAKSLVRLRRIDAAVVAQEKRRVISRERLLEWFDPLLGGLDAVGGLDVLKGWLVSRRSAYSQAARDYGLPAPKGALLVGVPGCGKSLTAKAIATAWQVPLLRLDLGALKSKFVGESEGNLRRALSVIDAVGRCVVWIDEIEKALAGATQGAADGGVSSDALGTVLSWMQDRGGESFVIATANDVSALPPELMRKGRFDQVWFVDLPTTAERGEIVRAALRAHGRGHLASPAGDWGPVAAATVGFTGSEVAELVPDALYAAFADGGREVTEADLLAAAGTVTPLAKTAAEKIERLRAWADGRARLATTPETVKAAGGVRSIDL